MCASDLQVYSQTNIHTFCFNSGIPPAPRGTPQIEVEFAIDANGILQVSAVDKGTGKTESITITEDTGRLSKADVDRMLKEAEQYAEEDKVLKDNIDCRNGLESYLYNLKNTLEDDSMAGNISATDKKDLQDITDEALDWMEGNGAWLSRGRLRVWPVQS